MRAYILGGLIVVGVLLTAGKIAAHHSFAAEFDANKPITLKGRVTKIEWTNPHVWFYINVKDEKTGEVSNWGAEMGPPHGLQRRGWRRDTLKVGEEVTVSGSLAKNGSKRVNARQVTMTSTGARPGETLDAVSSQGSNP
jgi:ribosomal protein L39E